MLLTPSLGLATFGGTEPGARVTDASAELAGESVETQPDLLFEVEAVSMSVDEIGRAHV